MRLKKFRNRTAIFNRHAKNYMFSICLFVEESSDRVDHNFKLTTDRVNHDLKKSSKSIYYKPISFKTNKKKKNENKKKQKN